MMRKLIYILLLTNNTLEINAQAGIDMYPKTPDAAAASKVSDIPAGNYTGVASFTIPLYTINSRGVQIPIELQYTTTGVKVSEIASRVGLGWSLNVGASLSQQIYGKPDNPEKFRKYTINTIENPLPTTCNGGSNTNPLCEAFLSAIGITVTNGLEADLIPDVFSYQLLDQSGKFIYDFSGEYGIPMPYNQLKIKPVRGLLGEDVEMIGENGTKYSFINTHADLEYFSSCQTGELPINPDFTPLYKIKSIEFPNKNIVEYKYLKSINSKFISSISEQENIYNKESTKTAPWYTLTPEKCINKTHSREQVLTEINFSDGKILFYYNNDELAFSESIRQDLIGDAYLTRVMVKSLSNQTISDTSLIYDYFESDFSSGNYPDEAEANPDTFKRLKLTSVRNNLTSTSYKLKYFGDDNGKKLPNRFSFSQDFWGVYNGQSNTTGIATVKAKGWDSIIRVYPGANKEPDINFGIIGNLQKIQYPHGGYTEIIYEADDYIKNSYVPALYHYEEVGTGNVYDVPIEFDIPINSYNKTITLFDPANPNPEPTDEVDPDGCRYKLERKENNSFITIVPSGNNHGGNLGTFDRNDPPGRYRLSTYKNIDYRFSSDEKCKAHYDWITEDFVSDNETRKTGTIRVQKIEQNSIDNGKIVRSYTYIDPNTGKSSGINAGEELFVSLSYNEVPIPPTGWYGTYAQQLNRINNPGWQINTVRGKAVGYDYVQETYESSLNPSKNFKKQQKFKNEVDNNYSYNYSNPVNVSWPTLDLDRGLILEEKLFNKEGDSIRVTKMKYDNDYYFNQYASMNFLPSPQNSTSPFVAQGLEIKIKTFDVGPGGDKSYLFNKQLFDINNIWIKNVKTTTTDYVNNEPTLVTEQTTAYSTNAGQNRHTFPESQTSTVKESGITSSQNYKYAHDLNNSYLKDKNVISIPLETEVKKNGITISKSFTNYPQTESEAKLKIINNTDNKDFPLPFYVESQNIELGGGMDKQISYDFYDNKGNLVQYTLKPDDNGVGIPVTIIWGYNQTQPIAKIEGAKLSDITQSEINVIVNASNVDASEAPNHDESLFLTALDNFRKAFPNYQITTYSYDPLIGVRSITPPSGVREIYKYDTAHRLKEVVDINGNILKEYKYKYKQ